MADSDSRIEHGAKPKAIGYYSCGHAVGLSGYNKEHEYPKCPQCGIGDFIEMHKVI